MASQVKKIKKGSGKASAARRSARHAKRSTRIGKPIPFDPAADQAERTKIGKTLDMKAFMKSLQRDATSIIHWETPE